MSSLMQYYSTRLFQAGFLIVSLISDILHNIISAFQKNFTKKNNTSIILKLLMIYSSKAPPRTLNWGDTPG